jgi:hypothetical protein
MHLLFHMLYRRQFLFPVVVEALGGGRFKFGCVLPHTARRRVTTFAHARVVPESALVQIRVG